MQTHSRNERIILHLIKLPKPYCIKKSLRKECRGERESAREEVKEANSDIVELCIFIVCDAVLSGMFFVNPLFKRDAMFHSSRNSGRSLRIMAAREVPGRAAQQITRIKCFDCNGWFLTDGPLTVQARACP